jgi:hypothetical protein
VARFVLIGSSPASPDVVPFSHQSSYQFLRFFTTFFRKSWGLFTVFAPTLPTQLIEPEKLPRIPPSSIPRRACATRNKQAVRHRPPRIDPIWNPCVYLDLAPIEGPRHHPRPELHSPKEKYFAPSRKKPVTRPERLITTPVARAASPVPQSVARRNLHIEGGEGNPPRVPHLCRAPLRQRWDPTHQINCPNPLSTNHLPRSNEPRLDSSERAPRNRLSLSSARSSNQRPGRT